MSRKSLVPFVLPADPTNALEAATKQYVDGRVTEVDWSSSLSWINTAGGGSPALGSGSVKTAYYQRIGNWVDFAIYMGFGTTGLNGGTLSLGFNLPFAPVAEVWGGCKLYIPGAAANFTGMCYANGGTTTVQPMFIEQPSVGVIYGWRGADGTAATGTGVPRIGGQYSVQPGGNLTLSLRYKV